MTGKQERTFGERLLKSAREAAAIARGEIQPARTTVYRVTARAAEVPAPPRFSPGTVRQIRERMGLSQQLFAGVLNVSAASVRAWEQGKRQPEGPTRRLLQLAERSPEVFLYDVQERPARREQGARARPVRRAPAAARAPEKKARKR